LTPSARLRSFFIMKRILTSVVLTLLVAPALRATTGITSLKTLPGSSTTTVQFNDNHAFNGDPAFQYDKNTHTVKSTSGTFSGTVGAAKFQGNGSELTGLSTNQALADLSNSTRTLGLTANNTNYINNTGTLQAGTTFFVSSGTVAGNLVVRSTLTVYGAIESTSSMRVNGATLTAALVWPDGTIQFTAPTGGTWIGYASSGLNLSSYTVTFASSIGFTGLEWYLIKQLTPPTSFQFLKDKWGMTYHSTGTGPGAWVPDSFYDWHTTTGAYFRFLFDNGTSSQVYESLNSNGVDPSSVTGRYLGTVWSSSGMNQTWAPVIGPSTGAIFFPGSDMRFTLGSQTTICGWFKPYSLVSAANSSIIWKGNAPAANTYEYQVQWGNGGGTTDRFNMVVANNTGTTISSIQSTGTVINVNNWNSYCATWDANAASRTDLWVNGNHTSNTSTEVGGSYTPNSSEICFGARCDDREIEHFNGEVGPHEFSRMHGFDAHARRWNQMLGPKWIGGTIR
jgi:hypothetical protein